MRLCPSCGRVNPPEADLCVYCAAALIKPAAPPWTRTPPTASLEIPIAAQGWLFGGIGAAYDGRTWSDDLLAQLLYIFPLGLFNDFHVYLRQAETRPYISLYAGGYDIPEMDGGGADQFFWAAGGTAGLRYNYDECGSYVFGGGGLGYRRRGGESYDKRDGAVLIFRARFTHFFYKYLGVTGSIQGWNLDLLGSAGAALAL